MLVSLGALAGACWRDVRLLPAAATKPDGASDALPGAETGGDVAADSGAPLACSGAGDPIRLATAAGPVCAAALEARGHRFVLCSCKALAASARIRTDAFDSRDASVQDERAAAIGVGGGLQSTAEVRAGGALYVAGSDGVRASDHVQTGGTLRVGGPLAMLSSMAEVAGDAFVAGDLTGTVRVAGALHVPAAAAVGGDTEAASIVREAVTVGAPCDCGAGFVDLGATIAAAAASNGDAAAGLAPAALAAVSAATRLDLPCGALYLTSIGTSAAVTLAVHGHALLVVDGDVVLRGSLSVALDPSAELDLVIGGRLSASGGGALGSLAAPARFRIWIAGTSTIVLDDQPSVGAVIRAPQAALSASSGLSLRGSLLAASVDLRADSSLHFDRAILEAGVPCGEPAAAIVP